jgi:hypothetical protein
MRLYRSQRSRRPLYRRNLDVTMKLLKRLAIWLDDDFCLCGSHLDEWGPQFGWRPLAKRFQCPKCFNKRSCPPATD